MFVLSWIHVWALLHDMLMTTLALHQMHNNGKWEQVEMARKRHCTGFIHPRATAVNQSMRRKLQHMTNVQGVNQSIAVLWMGPANVAHYKYSENIFVSKCKWLPWNMTLTRQLSINCCAKHLIKCLLTLCNVASVKKWPCWDKFKVCLILRDQVGQGNKGKWVGWKGEKNQ